MLVALIISIAVILGSVLMLFGVLRRPHPDMRRRISAGFASLMLGFAVLIAATIPSGRIGLVTICVFVAAAAWFMFLEWRSSRRTDLDSTTMDSSR